MTGNRGNLTPRMHIFRYRNAPPPYNMLNYEYGTVEMDSAPSNADDDRRLEGLKKTSVRVEYNTPIIPCGAANFEGDDDFDKVVPNVFKQA